MQQSCKSSRGEKKNFNLIFKNIRESIKKKSIIIEPAKARYGFISMTE